MNNLPDDIKRIIWEFDNTYHKKYKTCISQIKDSKKLHVMHKKKFYCNSSRKDRLSYSKFMLKYYVDCKYSQLLFKWYYSDLTSGKYYKLLSNKNI